MKTPEDEAFDDLARKQGAWGGGFPAKRQMAMDKINADFDEEYKKMHEDRINYGTAWSQDGKRIDPTSVYKEQPAQEPRNVRERWNVELDGNDLLVCFNDHEKGDKCQYERYSPQRTWVGLTAEEAAECWTTSATQTWKNFEAKIKDKNNG